MTREEIILNETKKRMKHLYEYSFYKNGVFEDGEDANADPNGDSNAMGGAPDMNGNMGGGDPNAMGGAPDMNGNMGGGDPNAMGGAPDMNGNMGGDPNAMGGDPNMNGNMGGDSNAMGGDPNAMGDGINGADLAPNAGMDDDSDMGVDGMGDDTMNGEQPGPDDDVVDITSLTDAQEELQQTQDEIGDKMADVDDKLTTLMKVVNKFTKALDANDEKIRDLKRELIKRAPNDEETMNVRLNAGGNPFEQKPEEFWNKFKDINNHYNITANNEAPQYQITKGDIDNVNDRIISDSIDDDEEEIPDSLKGYFER